MDKWLLDEMIPNPAFRDLVPEPEPEPEPAAERAPEPTQPGDHKA